MKEVIVKANKLERIKMFLKELYDELYNNEWKQLNITNIIKKYRIRNEMSKILKDKNIIVRNKSYWKWIQKTKNSDIDNLAIDVCKDYEEIIARYNKNHLYNIKEETYKNIVYLLNKGVKYDKIIPQLKYSRRFYIYNNEDLDRFISSCKDYDFIIKYPIEANDTSIKDNDDVPIKNNNDNQVVASNTRLRNNMLKVLSDDKQEIIINIDVKDLVKQLKSLITNV